MCKFKMLFILAFLTMASITTGCSNSSSSGSSSSSALPQPSVDCGGSQCIE